MDESDVLGMHWMTTSLTSGATFGVWSCPSPPTTLAVVSSTPTRLYLIMSFRPSYTDKLTNEKEACNVNVKYIMACRHSVII